MAEYCAYRLLQSRGPPAQFENVQQLVLASIKKFNATQHRDLVRSNSPNAPILEDQYQKELYRVLFKFGFLVSQNTRSRLGNVPVEGDLILA